MYVRMYTFLSSVAETWVYQSYYNVALFVEVFPEKHCPNLEYNLVSINYTSIMYKHFWKTEIHLNKSFL